MSAVQLNNKRHRASRRSSITVIIQYRLYTRSRSLVIAAVVMVSVSLAISMSVLEQVFEHGVSDGRYRFRPAHSSPRLVRQDRAEGEVPRPEPRQWLVGGLWSNAYVSVWGKDDRKFFVLVVEEESLAQDLSSDLLVKPRRRRPVHDRLTRSLRVGQTFAREEGDTRPPAPSRTTGISLPVKASIHM